MNPEMMTQPPHKIYNSPFDGNGWYLLAGMGLAIVIYVASLIFQNDKCEDKQCSVGTPVVISGECKCISDPDN